MKIVRNTRRLATAAKWASWGLLAAALDQELSRPAEEREWNGTVAGFVPYDFRPPTFDRARRALWDPEGALITPGVWGVGWTLNLGRAAHLAEESQTAQ